MSIENGANQSSIALEQGAGEIICTPAWRGLKQQVLHLAQFGGSIQVVLGAVDAGKTTFFTQLQNEGVGAPLVSISVARDVTANSFFYELVEGLGLRPEVSVSLGQLIASLRGYVQSLIKERSRVVVAVDDAHFLADSGLAALISVLQGSVDSGVGLHIILLSEQGLAEKIDKLELLDITVHDAQLPSFSPSEVKELLLDRIDLGIMTAEQVQTVWSGSKGVPGEAIRLAHGLYSQQRERTSFMSFAGLPMAHFASLILLCAILVWAFMLRTQETDNELPSVEVKTEPSLLVAKELLSEAEAVVQQAEPGGRGQLIELSSNSVPTAEPVTTVQDSKVVDAELAIGVEIINDVTNKVEPPAMPVVTSKAINVPNSLLKEVAENKLPISNNSIEASFLSRSETRLLGYSSSGFVLQLMATSYLDKLKGYVLKQSNRNNLAIYEGSRKGKAMYILVEGFYADKQSSLTAIGNLPKNQRKGKPWPKRLQSIQREIKDNRRK